MMTLRERIEVLHALGKHLAGGDEFLEALIKRTHFNNQWLSPEFYQQRLQLIIKQYLQQDLLTNWTKAYSVKNPKEIRTVAVVLNGQTPLIGFEDIIQVFIAGHRAQIKLEDGDKFVLPYLIKKMVTAKQDVQQYFDFVEKINKFDGVIAKPNNQTFAYFKTYFGKFPNIIRQSKHTVAVLSGQEEEEDLRALGRDVFSFFGLGEKSVGKIYVPKHYDFDMLLNVLHEYRKIILHTKYKNNFDYNYALFMLNKVPMYNNGCIIMTENKAIQSRIAGLHYEYYENITDLEIDLYQNRSSIEQVVAKENLLNGATVPLGKAHETTLPAISSEKNVLGFLLKTFE